MGPDTKLDLDWSGSGSMKVYVDGMIHQEKTQGTYTNLGLGSGYVRDTLHEVCMEAAPGAIISTMHIHHHWMSIEIDWIDGYEPPDLNAVETYLEDYYRQHTHGRIDVVIDEAVPYSGPFTDTSELVYIGQVYNGGYFQHRNDRSWFYHLYIPQSDIPGGGLCWVL
jgi:hypothetical protein